MKDPLREKAQMQPTTKRAPTANQVPPASHGKSKKGVEAKSAESQKAPAVAFMDEVSKPSTKPD